MERDWLRIFLGQYRHVQKQMQVTRENFRDELPAILRVIEEADFIAVDTELTGIHSGVRPREQFFDSLTDRYASIAKDVRDLLITQFGFCPVKWVEQKKCWVFHPVNVWIFPRDDPLVVRKLGVHSTFAVEASGFSFLSGQNFDFVKWVKEGLEYLRIDQYGELKANVEEDFARLSEMRAARRCASRLSCDGKFQDEFFDTVWGADIKEQLGVIRAAVDSWLLSGSERDAELVLPVPSGGASRGLRKLCHRMLETYADLRGEYVEDTANGDLLLRIVALTAEEVESRELVEHRENLNRILGFSSVIEAVCRARKPIVGHNMLRDMMHLVSQFLCPLPDTYAEFVRTWTSKFPLTLDAKVLALRCRELSSSKLHKLRHQSVAAISECYRDSGLVPFVLADGCSAYSDDVRLHEAGYDAFATALNFLYGLTELAAEGDLKGVWTGPPQLGLVAMDTRFQSLRNKVFIYGSVFPYFPLDPGAGDAREDLIKPNEFLVSRFDIKTTTDDILGWFEGLGEVQVRWLDDTSCIVAVNPEMCKDVVPRFQSQAYCAVQSLRTAYLNSLEGSGESQ